VRPLCSDRYDTLVNTDADIPFFLELARRPGIFWSSWPEPDSERSHWPRGEPK
jgi:hypothetical protein